MSKAFEQRSLKGGPVRKALSAITALLVAAVGMLVASPASAAPVYEITAKWADDTPQVVQLGDPVFAEIRVNVNDDAQAPSNDPVEDVTFDFTVDNGYFEEIPDNCVTADVTTPSSISEDGKTLTCNLGTQEQGTAHVVTPAVVVDGPTGSQVSGTAEIDGQTAPLDPVEIITEFQMDMVWGAPSAGSNKLWENAYGTWFNWTLNLKEGSEPGPEDITFRLRIATNTGTIHPYQQTCEPFIKGQTHGHPWSGGDHPSEQMAPFVDSCTLTKVNETTFDLELKGIDYSLAQVPTVASSGSALPSSWNAVASGRIHIRVSGATSGPVLKLKMNPYTYTAPGSGDTWVDDPSNNESDKNIPTGSGASMAWARGYTGSGGDSWDDTYRVSRGTEVRQFTSWDVSNYTGNATDIYGVCHPLDVKYVTFVKGEPWAKDPENFPLQYYVGGHARVNPNHSNYNPEQFNCGADPGNWVNEPPADLSTVRAVRSMASRATANSSPTDRIGLNIYVEVKSDAPIGQDIWSVAQRYHPGTGWVIPPGNTVWTNTPGARYPYTHTFRDILRVIEATPEVEKTADRSAITPGVPVNFTVTYSAEGAGAIPPTVDNFRISDTLPVGMTYVEGSASIEPEVTTNGQGEQRLGWVLDDVETNVKHPLTYQAVASSDVQPGTVLTNTAKVNYGSGGPKTARASVGLSDDGYTSIGKTAHAPYMPNPDGDGDSEGSWTVALRSYDPRPQAFTDTIDILPYNGDDRGTDFSGGYEVTGVDAVSGATVYYTNADPAELSDDPHQASNGAPGDVSGNTVGWSTTKPADATAVRVIGPELPAYATQAFTVEFATTGMDGGDDLVNRAQGVAGHTELVMRTSAPITMANYYSASLKKYVQDSEGQWRDANTVEDYPVFGIGDDVNYRIVVENTGQGTLTGIEVSDDKEPELGSFIIDELAPGETETHEFTITTDESMGDGIVNTACAAADIPEDSGIQPEINCDPAGFEISGDPTHTKTIASAAPIGDGQWEVVYELEVENTSTAPTTYSLADELRFTDQVDVVSAEVTATPDGVTLTDPAWDGGDNLQIAGGVDLVGNENSEYTSHVYELTVKVDVPMQFEPPSEEGELPATECDAEGADTNTALNNTSALSKPSGDTEDDQACAPLPSISIEKSVSQAASENPDGTWTLAYEVTATNDGDTDGNYDLSDRLRYGEGVEVETAEVTSAPDGVTVNPGWTGDGDDGAPENTIVTGVNLEAGASHTYLIEVTSSLNHETVSTESLECPAPGSGEEGGFANTAAIAHNGGESGAEACDSPPTPNTPQLQLPILGGTGLTPYLIAGGFVMLVALLAIRRAARAS